MGFPGGTSGKELAWQFRRHRRHLFDLWVGKIPLGGNGNPFQYSCLENPRDRGFWPATVNGGHKESDMTEVTWHACMQKPQTYSIRIHSLSRYQVIHTYVKVWEACCEVYLIRMKLGKGPGKYKLSFKFCVKFLWYTKKEPLSNGCYLDLSTYD